MSSFLENFGVSLGGYAQSAYDAIGDGLKAGVSLWGSGIAKFLEFDGWLLQKAADGIGWGVSATWDVARAFITGGLFLPELEGHGDQDADAAHAPSPVMPPAPAVEPVAPAHSLAHDAGDADVALLVVGLPAMMDAIDWHQA
ncbi:conserved hypothetical protein [Hyphomicrobiales bacterium]|nr:conserved hypothetical protein [Hyphomicrobiales bacterium]CAH1670524.1 conserved hypothetical protein [Hyphomicrobiales bacterium]